MCGTIASLPKKKVFCGLFARKGDEGYVFYCETVTGQNMFLTQRKIGEINKILGRNYRPVFCRGSREKLLKKVNELNIRDGLPGVGANLQSAVPTTQKQVANLN